MDGAMNNGKPITVNLGSITVAENGYVGGDYDMMNDEFITTILPSEEDLRRYVVAAANKFVDRLLEGQKRNAETR
jgi:hypothetical protein